MTNEKTILGSLFLALVTFFLVTILNVVSANEKKTIVVATDSDTKPFTYRDNDSFKGYDIDVLKAIFENSKDYQLEFQTTAFSSILTGIDSGRYQIAANDFNYNSDRAKKYYFSKPISQSHYAIASKKKSVPTHLKNLSGKSTEGVAGSNYVQVLENWNKNHDNEKPIKIKYVSASSPFTQRIQDLEQGKIDFLMYDNISLNQAIDDQGFQLYTAILKDKVSHKKKEKNIFFL